MSAARLLGLPVPRTAYEHVTVTLPSHRRRHPGIRSHVCRDTSDLIEVDGLRSSSPLRSFVEMGGLLNLVDLVVVGDHLVRQGLVTPAGLRDYVRGCTLTGARPALRAAEYVRAAVDSPMESRLRMLLVLGGLPEPAVNLLVRDRDGTPLRRYDLSYPPARVAIEYDGRHHVERIEEWEKDLARREAIDDARWRLVVLTSRDVYSTPERTLRRVHQILASRRLAGLSRQPSESWRPHFG